MSSTWHKNAVAVSGIFASGKSTVCKILSDLGAYVIDADQIAHSVLEVGSPGLDLVAKEFGQDLIKTDGSLDRKKLGNLIFSDPSMRSKLEGITHPLIREEAKRLADLCPADTLLIYDCPLLFETGLNKLEFKKIVLVTAPSEASIDRAMERSGISKQAATARLASQMPLKDKVPLADIVIENNSSREELVQKTRQLYEELVATA